MPGLQPARGLPERNENKVITKRNARAILLDGDELVLIKRTKPGRDPYWVTAAVSRPTT